MRIAQQLYEGIDIKRTWTIGVITYLRTDSTRISDEAVGMAASIIKKIMVNNIFQIQKKSVKTTKKFRTHMRQ